MQLKQRITNQVGFRPGILVVLAVGLITSILVISHGLFQQTTIAGILLICAGILLVVTGRRIRDSQKLPLVLAAREKASHLASMGPGEFYDADASMLSGLSTYTYRGGSSPTETPPVEEVKGTKERSSAQVLEAIKIERTKFLASYLDLRRSSYALIERFAREMVNDQTGIENQERQA